ncbi:MAG TPA: hypothetical protein VMZ53_12445, partial [Kofleriaceae bacterium]|nr:hypothetical protein [Kofleriaceae bacterium]
MTERFERLLTLRGDAVKGLPVSAWEANLNDVDRDQLLRAVIDVIRKLLLPDWEVGHKDDRRPQAALEAAEKWIETKSADAATEAKTAAKACTAARNETFGKDHRAPEAARAVAWAAGAKDNSNIWEALTAIEGELLARITLVGEYHRQPEMRRAIVDALRNALTPKQAATESATSSDPVPYAASGNFAVGQKLVHAKFGNMVVAAAGDKWIDVDLEDGTRKRLAQKP